MKKLLIICCVLPLSLLVACGDRVPLPSTGSAPPGTEVSVDGEIMPAERGFAVAEAGYTALANVAADLIVAKRISPAQAAVIRDINQQAIPVLQAGRFAVSSVGIIRATTQLLGLRDRLRTSIGAN